jgi:cell division protein FtsZ
MISVSVTGVEELCPRIAVIGVGGGGGNAVDNMIRSGVAGVDFLVANTDSQALRASLAERRIQLGRRLTSGLGAGSREEVGRAAAEEALPEIVEALEGAHMCFIAAGMGGGTGTGAAPVIARAARGLGILTVGVVTRPFAFEGRRRSEAAGRGVEALEAEVDTLIVLPNQNLFRLAGAETTFRKAFELADDVLRQGVRGITDLMVRPGLINLDFADVRTVMMAMGRAVMGAGEAAGEDRAIEAAERAVANPLLDDMLTGARGLIISIVGGEDLRLMEVDAAAMHIRDMVDPDADIIWGSAFDPELEGRIRVSVVATGLGAPAGAAAEAPPASAAVPEDVAAPEPAAPELPLLAPPAEAEPEAEEELMLVMDMLAPDEPEASASEPEPEPVRLRGPSLFERMADAARGAARSRAYEDALEGPGFARLRTGAAA